MGVSPSRGGRGQAEGEGRALMSRGPSLSVLASLFLLQLALPTSLCLALQPWDGRPLVDFGPTLRESGTFFFWLKVLSYKVHPWSPEDAPKYSPPLPSAPAVPLLQSRGHILTHLYLSPVKGPGRSPSSFAATCLTGATKTGVLTSSSSPTEPESASGLGLRPWLVS